MFELQNNSQLVYGPELRKKKQGNYNDRGKFTTQGFTSSLALDETENEVKL